MPYITKTVRKHYDPHIEALVKNLNGKQWSSGDITYVIYMIIKAWFDNDTRYATICSIRGVLAGVANEFNRREAHPYEDNKIEVNGDV